MPQKTKKHKRKLVGNGDSPIIITDSSSTDDRKPAIAAGLYISHPNFRGTIEVTVSDPGYEAYAIQAPQTLDMPLTVPWIVTVNNSLHISSIKPGVVHLHFNSLAYDVGVYEGNPSFVVGGQMLNTVTLLNNIVPNANLTNEQVFQGPGNGSTVEILFQAVTNKNKKKKKKK